MVMRGRNVGHRGVDQVGIDLRELLRIVAAAMLGGEQDRTAWR